MLPPGGRSGWPENKVACAGVVGNELFGTNRYKVFVSGVRYFDCRVHSIDGGYHFRDAIGRRARWQIPRQAKREFCLHNVHDVIG